MGERVDHVEILRAKDFGLKRSLYYILREKYEDSGDTAESNFLDGTNLKHCFKEVGDSFLEVVRFWWQGEYSAHAMPLLIETILPQFEGTADIVFFYESGGQEGYRLEDHKVTPHRVVTTLGDPITT